MSPPIHPLRGARFNRRGSLLIFVVVALVLLAVLGVAFLQVARLDRLATEQAETGSVDTVARSIISAIQDELENDLTFRLAADQQEPYDYPWTNPASSPTAVPYVLQQANANATGGEGDDMWLASSEPDLGASPVQWPHITNLFRVYLRNGVDNSSDFDGYALTDVVEDVVDYASAGTDVYRRDRDLDWNQPFLVDADGDGIGDSRWTWPPIKQVSGVLYIAAVRIIDNSAMSSFNTGMGLGQDVSGAYTYDTTAMGTDAPLWHRPSEVDIGRFVFSNPAASMTELRALLDFRRGGTVGSTLVPGAVRDLMWSENGRYYVHGSPVTGAALTMGDEMELRHRNGRGSATATPVELQMPSFLRQAAGDEGPLTPTPTTDAEVQAHFRDEPRHQITAVSGAGLHVITSDPTTNTLVRGGRVDLNMAEAWTGSTAVSPSIAAADAPGIANVIYRAVSGTTTGMIALDVTQWCAQMAGASDFLDLADQFAANIVDFGDVDNILTYQASPTATGRYGFEALPFLTEVYAQRRYRVTTATVSTPDTGGPDPDYTADWQAVGDAGYAIEIRNPFRFPISLHNVELYAYVDGNVVDVRWTDDVNNDGTPDGAGDDVDGDGDSDLADLVAGVVPTGVLQPDQVLILHRHSNANGNAPNDDTSDDATHGIINTSDSGFTFLIVQVPHDWPSDNTPAPALPPGGFSGQPVDVVLQARTTNTVQQLIPYSKAVSKSAPDSFVEVVVDLATPPAPPDSVAYWQYASIGNGNRINAMAIHHDHFTFKEELPQVTAGGGTRNRQSTLDALGTADKTGAGGPANRLAPGSEQLVMGNHGALASVGLLPLVTILGPTPTATVPEVIYDLGVTSLNAFRMQFPATPSIGDGTRDSLNIPHAAYLIDQFTTMAPDLDFVDNDGDGLGVDANNDGLLQISTDPAVNEYDADELLIPGLVNINTMPDRLLDQVLPIPDATLRSQVVAAIAAYRDNTTRTATGRTRPGIAMIGELFAVNREQSAFGLTADGLDNDAMTGAGASMTRVDFLSNPAADQPDGISEDHEEALLVPHWLSQLCSTRSDIFTAYIRIEGRPVNDFGTIVEGRNLIVVFDRSRLTTDGRGRLARVLGVFEWH